MPIAEEPVRREEADALFRGLEDLPGMIVAVSGGPDSTALLFLVAQWAKRLKHAPKLLAVTIDHGLRPESAAEAAAVRRLARTLGVPHRTLRWRGDKPTNGLQERARQARYVLLGQAAAKAGCAYVLTAHTLDDQAETVLFRLARGSGLSGLAGMAPVSLLPRDAGDGSTGKPVFLLRPLLAVPKSRLVATLAACRIPFADDPSNTDARFTRARLRPLMSRLAQEGLDAKGLSRLARRLRRAESAIEFAVAAAQASLAPPPWPPFGPISLDTVRFCDLPAEIGLRLLGRAVAHAGNEGPVELAKLEALYDALGQRPPRLRRTLAGAVITLSTSQLVVGRAPARRLLAMRAPGKGRLKK